MGLPAGTQIGPYEVRPLEGRGASAEVYRALDTRLSREVALKVVDLGPGDDRSRRRAVARLEREARILASLEHPNIARVHGLEQANDVRALVMELVEGPTLADRIAAGPIPVPETLDIARQIAAALESAHDHGVIHRDLKPSNIKFASDGIVKVLDFGLARVLRPPQSSDGPLPPTVTDDGTAVGTAAYMSPEQARGREVDERTDIWAFGCVVYEMLTGTRAFPGDDRASTFASVLGSEPDWARVPSAVPRIARVFLQRCLSKERTDRPRHIGDVRLALEGRFDTPTNETEQHTRRVPPARRFGWWRVAAAIAMALGAGAAARLSVSWLSGSSQPAKSYVIHAPDGTRFLGVTMEPFPAVSPDGEYVVYRAGDDTAPPVWLQRLGEMTARRLPDSQGAGRPFWSPDGQYIGIAGPAGVQTIAVTGGSAPQRVCSCPVTGGGTWAADGTILFAHDGGMSRVAVTGGPVTPVTTVSQERGEFAHQHPVFLPDGQRFLYLVRSLRPEHRGVYLAALNDPTRRTRLLPDDSNVSLGTGPDGGTYLFFVRDVTLLAQPFDVKSGALAGSPLRIAPRVVPGEGGRFAPFATGGRSLVLRQSTALRNRLRWFDRRGIPQAGALDVVGSFRYVALAPDGRRVIVARHDAETTKLDLWLHDLERNVSERVTSDAIGAFFPVWTPDAERVIYASAREGPWHLFWRASTRPDAGRLFAARLPFTKYPTQVTPDGRQLLFTGDGAVWSLPLAPGSVPTRLVSGLQGRVSPDGRWLAYTSAENGRREVYVTAFPTPQVRWRVSTDGGEDPQWRSDGRELFFLDAERTLVAAAVTATPSFLVPNLQHLFRVALQDSLLRFGPAYAVDPGGERFLFIERVDDEEIVLTARENWLAQEQ